MPMSEVSNGSSTAARLCSGRSPGMKGQSSRRPALPVQHWHVSRPHHRGLAADQRADDSDQALLPIASISCSVAALQL